MFELFDHTADLGLRVRAASLELLLVEAARGIVAMQLANPESVRPVLSKSIELTAEDPSYLLFDWLSELLFSFDSDKLLFSQFDIRLQPKDASEAVSRAALQLTAVCRGEPMERSRHQMEHEVKAITYHGLHVEQQADGQWFAEVIVDI